MTPPWALAVDGAAGWLQLLIGLALLFVLGAGLANRLLPGDPRRLWLAPVAACSALPLLQILLDALLGTPVTETTTWLLAGALTVWAWNPTLRAWLAEGHPVRVPKLPSRKSLLRALGVLAVLVFVAGVQSLSHIPGDPTAGPHTAYPDLVARWAQGLAGDDYPYPIHVDEHIHIAQTMQMSRGATLSLEDPYTGAPKDLGLFSISGLRTERGFELLTLQLSHLTGLSISAIYRFTPALWAGVIAGTLWASLRPHPGALASAAVVAAMPSTARMLGPGFLIPSTFALAWVPATLWLTLRGTGGGRFAGILLLVTGAFFMHTVLGVVAILASLAAILVLDVGVRHKGALALATCLPLVWILPIVWQDAKAAVNEASELPFAFETFASLGPGLLGMAAVAIAMTLLYKQESVHRAWAVVGAVLGTSIVVSIATGHDNEATYTRIIFSAYLALAALVGLAAASAQAWLASKSNRPRLAQGAVVALVLVSLAWPIATNLNMPIYRLWDEESWALHEELGNAATEESRFLSDPWLAPLYAGFSDAEPHTVLYPGAGPERGGDWTAYTRGAINDTWLRDADIQFVVEASSDPTVEIGPRLYTVPPK